LPSAGPRDRHRFQAAWREFPTARAISSHVCPDDRAVLGDLPEDPERIGAPIVEHLFKLPEAVPAHRSSLTTAARRVNLG